MRDEAKESREKSKHINTNRIIGRGSGIGFESASSILGGDSVPGNSGACSPSSARGDLTGIGG